MKVSARQRLLSAAADCFYDQGVHATGIDTITAAAGVAKMSLYNNFSSKDDLVSAYLDARHEEWLELYRGRLAAGDGSGAAGVRAVFLAYQDHAEFAYRNGFRGCGLLNAAAELPAGAPGRSIVRAHKEQVQALLVDQLRAAGVPAEQVDGVSLQLSFLLEGAMSRAGLEGDSRLLHAATSMADQLVATAGGRR